MTYQPKHLKQYERPPNYAGPDYYDYFFAGVGQSRDSDNLERANFTAMLDLAIELNIECQYYAGEHSCINIYSMSEPDESDWQRFERCLDAIDYRMTDNEAYKLVKATLGKAC